MVMHASVSGICMCMQMDVCICACWLRPEVYVICLPLLLSIWTRSSMIQPDVRPASTGILLSLPPQLWVSSACPAFYVGAGDLNSGPQACTGTHWATSPAPQFSSYTLLHNWKHSWSHTCIQSKSINSYQFIKEKQFTIENKEELQRESHKAQH